MSSMKFRFALVERSSRSRDRLREEWSSVLRQMDAPAYYHYFEWYDAYLESLEPEPKSIFFVVAYRDDQPVGIFPLRQAKGRIAGIRVRVLEVPHSPVTLLGDFVFQPRPATAGIIGELLEFLKSRRELRWDVVRISNTLDGSAARCSLKSGRPARAVDDDELGCHYVVCREFRISPKLKNKRNRLARVGNIEYAHVRDARSMMSAVDEFIEVEASGWKGSEGTAIRCRPREVAFYRNVAARFAETGSAQVSLLRVGGRCIAAFYMLRTGRTLYWLKHGFDEEFAKASPGQLLFTEVVQNCLDRSDVDEINFITNNEWHKIFAPRELGKRTTLIFRGNLLGLVSYAALRSKSVLRRFRDTRIVKRTLGGAVQRPSGATLPEESGRVFTSSEEPASRRELSSIS